MYPELSDDELDTLLRAVPVPDGLVSRLQAVVVPDDDQLDSALADVDPPPGFVWRLQQVIDDEGIDELVGAVGVPDTLLPRLRVVAYQRPRRPVRRMVMAASLILILFSSYTLTIGGMLATMRPADLRITDLEVIDFGPIEVHAEQFNPTHLVSFQLPRDEITEAESVPATPRVYLVRYDTVATPGPAGQLFADLRGGLDLGSDILHLRWGPLASPQKIDAPLPQLDHAEPISGQGVDLPIGDGYDRSYLLTKGTHPPCFPAVNGRLASVDVPLGPPGDSVSRTQRLLDERRTPRPHEIRVEDFLAEVEYDQLPPSDSDLRLFSTAGPAVFACQDRALLHIGVVAKRVVAEPTASTHLCIALDVSGSMKWNDHLHVARDAVDIATDHLSDHDTLSLVAFHHDVAYEAEVVSRESRDAFRNDLAQLRAGGGDNLVVGLQRALELSLEADDKKQPARRIVVITDLLSERDAASHARLTELLQLAREHDVSVLLLTLDDLQSRSDDVEWWADGLAETRAVTNETLAWELVEQVVGRSPLIARDARLRVEFNPDAVHAYRLMGHGPTAATGLQSTPGASLHSGEGAGAMFEVWLRDTDEDVVAWAVAHWADPKTGEPRQLPRLPVYRESFGASVADMPESLHAGAIAAEVAGRLRGEHDFRVRDRRAATIRKPAGWRDLMEYTDGLPEALASRRDISALRRLIGQLDQLHRSPGEREGR